jgi:hypothetical protein
MTAHRSRGATKLPGLGAGRSRQGGDCAGAGGCPAGAVPCSTRRRSESFGMFAWKRLLGTPSSTRLAVHGFQRLQDSVHIPAGWKSRGARIWTPPVSVTPAAGAEADGRGRVRPVAGGVAAALRRGRRRALRLCCDAGRRGPRGCARRQRSRPRGCCRRRAGGSAASRRRQEGGQEAGEGGCVRCCACCGGRRGCR